MHQFTLKVEYVNEGRKRRVWKCQKTKEYFRIALLNNSQVRGKSKEKKVREKD